MAEDRLNDIESKHDKDFVELQIKLDTDLSELQIKLAYAEDLLDALNTTVFRQQEQIDFLQEQLRSLQQQVQTSLPGEPGNPRDEIPPHY